MPPVTQIAISDIDAATQHDVTSTRSAKEDMASSSLLEIGGRSKAYESPDISPAGPTTTATTTTATTTTPSTTATTTPTATVAFAFETEPIDLPRLHRRLQTYGAVYNLPHDAVRQMDELLATPLARRLLTAPPSLFYDMLVQDAYKPRMHVMYDKFMTGVTADFALVVRRAPPAANPASLPLDQPALWARFEAAADGISRTIPYGPYEVAALRDLFGLELLQSLLERCHHDGVAPVSWQDRHTEGGAGRVAVASGPIISSSLVETSLMQRFQGLAVAAQSGSAGAPQHPLTRTERLASSLARLADTVTCINALNHGCKVALFAGRRSSDLLYLVLQNMYCAAHLTGYVGTSSLFAAAVIHRLQAAEGREVEQEPRPGPEDDDREGEGRGEGPAKLTEGDRKADTPGEEHRIAAAYGGLVRLVGTHAHEQVSALQQLLSSYDVEAGRRCGLPHAVAVTPLLAHLLFLAANGPDAGSGGGGGGGGSGGGVRGLGGTALADTFTTSAFLAVSRTAAVPAAFRADVAVAYGWIIPEHARCFDLFSTWRLDSGCYEWVAEQVVAAWEGRCLELAAGGLPGLRRPLLMHSNLESVEHIARVCELAPRIKPAILAFGTLADGFLPFLPPEEEEVEKVEVEAEQGDCRPHSRAHTGNSDGRTTPAVPVPASVAAASRPTVSLASVVMKLVQARPPQPIPPSPSQSPSAPSAFMSSSAYPSISAPLCAVKLGDGHHSGKAQVDPRMAPEAAAAALAATVDMAHGSACSPLDSAAVSAVLAEAYEAVTRKGILLEVPRAASVG